ncbi:MAG: hypothetical protein AB1540_03055 [Bdellovibrionota bacterium]
MLASFLAAATAFIVFIFVTALEWRVFKVRARLGVMLVNLVVSSALIPLLLPWFLKQPVVNAIPGQLQLALIATFVFVFLGYLYLQFFGVIEGSITLRSLIFFRKAPEQTLPLSRYKEFQPFDRIIQEKVELMPKMGLAALSKRSGNTVLTSMPKGRFMGALLFRAKNLFGWGQY